MLLQWLLLIKKEYSFSWSPEPIGVYAEGYDLISLPASCGEVDCGRGIGMILPLTAADRACKDSTGTTCHKTSE